MGIRAIRTAVAALLASAIVAVVAIALFNAGSSYTVVADVADAGQLVPGDQVKVGAAVVGSVQDIRLAPNGQARLVLSIDSADAPLRRGTTATIRQNSLVGSANRYVVLGPPPGRAGAIPSGGLIPITDTTSIVDLDALIDAFDPPTRLGLRLLIRGAAQEYAGRGEQAARSLQLLAPAFYGVDGVARQLISDEPAYQSLLRTAAAALGAIASQRGDLTDLVARANTTMAAIGSREVSLEQGLQRLPGTLTRTEGTFAAIRAALPPLQDAVTTAASSAGAVAPFLHRLSGLLHTAQVPVANLSTLVSSPGADNDLIDLERALPPLASLAAGAFPRAIATMDRSQNDLNELRSYTPDITALLTQLDLVTGYYDANGHYARIQPNLAAFHYDPLLNELEPQSASQRTSGFEIGATRRCPGGAMQPPPDASAPLASANCLLTDTPPA